MLGRKIIINDATSQLNRVLTALDDGYVEVDARSLRQLLSFSGPYGGLLNFFNLDNQIDGDWTDFFIASPTMVYAAISAQDSRELEQRYLEISARTETLIDYTEKFCSFKQNFEFIATIATAFNNWYEACQLIKSKDSNSGPQARLTRLIQEDLAPQLQRLKAYDLGAASPTALRESIGLNYSGFLPIWNLDFVGPDPSIYRGRTRRRRIDRALPCLTPIFYALIDALIDLKPYAVEQFEVSMEQSDHKPHLALYIAFAHLYSYPQKTLNTFFSRYKTFYYESLLKANPQPAIPDRTYLTFELAEDEEVRSSLVPLGTEFLAGQDEQGEDIIYRSDLNLQVTATEIGSIKTLRKLKGELTPAKPKREVLKQLLSSEILNPAGSAPDAAPIGWSSFGRTRVGVTPAEVTQAAVLGFALTSDYLDLSGGIRTICLEVSFSIDYVELVLIPILTELSNETGLSEAEIFDQIILNAFELSLTTTDGWMLVDYKLPERNTATEPDFKSFQIVVFLPDSAAAIAPISQDDDEESPEDISNTDFVPQIASLKGVLKQVPFSLGAGQHAVELYPLSVLDKMYVVQLQLSVTVENLSGLTLQNTDGEVDTESPFTVFGAVPVLGSYLLIMHPELFAKQPSCLSLTIDWFGLPQNELGFKGYYRDYKLGLSGQPQDNLFDNQVFLAEIQIDNPGGWFITDPVTVCPEKPDDGAHVSLFRAGKDCAQQIPPVLGKLCDSSKFDSLQICDYDNKQMAFYQPEQSAIRLTLSGPDYAFGNSLYSINVLKSVIDDLPNTESCREQCLTDCNILKHGLDCVSLCLKSIRDCQGDQACIKKAIVDCEACLLELIINALKSYAPGSSVDPIARHMVQFRKDLEVAIAVPGPERIAMIRECESRYRRVLSIFLTHVEANNFKHCLTLLEALLCIAKCWWIQNSRGKSSGYKCVLICYRDLEDAYKSCLTLCMNNCMSLDKELKYPNEPYLPMAEKISLTYQASCTISAQEHHCGDFYHLTPFGGYQLIDITNPFTLLPQFNYNGNLYLGLSGVPLLPEQTLLFQMGGQMFAEFDNELEEVSWQRLSANQWQAMGRKEVLSDRTLGLQKTGVVHLNLPVDQRPSTILSDQYEWLRLVINKKPEDFPDCFGVNSNAVLCSWEVGSSDGKHLNKPLPAGTINTALEALPDISSIVQPLATFAGRPAENQSRFEISLGERLRHKDRGVQSWDYERLVLARFPLIWKTIALAAQSSTKSDQAGHVLLVVVPGPDDSEILDSTVPSASLDTLREIQQYLEPLISPFVKLNVVNPVYVRIKVYAGVVFNTQHSEGKAKAALNQDLIQYLSPWFYNAQRAARNGQYVSESDIAEFIQTRPYVASLNQLKLKYSPEPDSLSGNWYFLTSAQSHKIIVESTRLPCVL